MAESIDTVSGTIQRNGIKNNCINEIQFLSALLVIYSHSFPIAMGGGGDFLYELTNGRWKFGSLCVAIFFLLSGFLCTQSYIHGDRFIEYIKNRVLRIFPGLIVVIFLTTFVIGPSVTNLSLQEYFSSPETWKYLKNIWPFDLSWTLPGVFADNIYGPSVNGSLWTIPYQLYLYLGLGLLGVTGILKKRKIALGLYLVSIICYLCEDILCVRITHFFGMPFHDWLYLTMLFMAGVVASLYADRIILSKANAMVAVLVIIFAWWLGEYYISMSTAGLYLILYFGFTYSCKNNFLKTISATSYGVYIYGFPVQQIMVYLYGGKMNPYLNTFIACPVTVCLAYISFICIEKPAAKLRKVSIIPACVKDKLSQMRNRILRIWELNLPSWKVIFSILGIIIVLAPFTDVKQSYYDFSERDYLKSVGDGYYTQNGSTFCWVTDYSTIELDPKGSELLVEGFVPDTFEEVTHLSIFVNSVLVKECDLSVNKYFLETVSDISSNHNFIFPNKCTVTLVFDGKKVPLDEDDDQRELSAGILKIGFVG